VVDSTVYSVAMTTRTKYAPLRHGVVTLGLVASALIGIGGASTLHHASIRSM